MALKRNCKGCSSSVRLKEKDIYEILEKVKSNKKEKDIVDSNLYTDRLAICKKCDDLLYETTCKYDGVLVYVKAKDIDSFCSKPGNSKW
ncbi:DUF6171 family protein [Natronospora cellulosivora (SeqCode)]